MRIRIFKLQFSRKTINFPNVWARWDEQNERALQRWTRTRPMAKAPVVLSAQPPAHWMVGERLSLAALPAALQPPNSKLNNWHAPGGPWAGKLPPSASKWTRNRKRKRFLGGATWRIKLTQRSGKVGESPSEAEETSRNGGWNRPETCVLPCVAWRANGYKFICNWFRSCK